MPNRDGSPTLQEQITLQRQREGRPTPMENVTATFDMIITEKNLAILAQKEIIRLMKQGFQRIEHCAQNIADGNTDTQEELKNIYEIVKTYTD